jgi:3-methyladenine DNA glycosylase AlkD
MAGLAVHDKKASDADFVALLPVIERESGDGRNFVKKAVNWALRNIGKRDAALNAGAVASARRILAQVCDGRGPEARAARWVAKDALRELEGDKVRARLGLPPLEATPPPETAS